MCCVERSRIKKLAVKKVVKDEVLPCRHCGGKSFSWDFFRMVKTCKQCKDESGVM